MTNQFDKPGKKKESFIPPKFCILSPWYVKEGMGGTEIQNYYIAQALMERGWEVHYIRETPAKISGKEKRDNGIILHAISRLSNHFKWLNLYSIFKISKKIKPRVWYIRGNISYVFPTVICAKLLGGVIIWNCSSELQVSSRKQALKKLNYYEKPFALINRYLYEKSLPYVDRRIVQTQNQKHMLKTNLKLSSSVLYNAHPKTERSGTERRPVILFIANLKPVKQPHLFIELAERCKNSQYIFKMVGKPGDKELMEKISEAQKTNKNFNYLGELSIDKVNGLLETARLLVCTSRYEGFSNVFIQAWLRGVPVISLSVDPDNLIRDHGLGHVSNTLNNAVSAIDDFMGDLTTWERHSQRCISFADNNFSLTKAVDAIEAMT